MEKVRFDLQLFAEEAPAQAQPEGTEPPEGQEPAQEQAIRNTPTRMLMLSSTRNSPSGKRNRKRR